MLSEIFLEAEVWVAFAFIIFLGLLGYVGAYRSIAKALDDRTARIKAELDDARRLLRAYDEVDIGHVPRAQNVDADALVNAALDAVP